jgi:toxin YoeB
LKEKHRVIIFDQQFREDLMWWFKTNKKIVFRILDLVEAVTQDPFSGMGKPEPLKYVEANTWSRRITQEHRLIYRVKDDSIQFLAARYHYQ